MHRAVQGRWRGAVHLLFSYPFAPLIPLPLSRGCELEVGLGEKDLPQIRVERCVPSDSPLGLVLRLQCPVKVVENVCTCVAGLFLLKRWHRLELLHAAL